jgi:hypothetical protein
MLDRTLSGASAILLLLVLLDAGAAQASVKCQCNNGTVTQAMGVDSDDDDLDAACNEACDMLGGGRVWNVDTDRDDNDGGNANRREDGGRPEASPRR